MISFKARKRRAVFPHMLVSLGQRYPGLGIENMASTSRDDIGLHVTDGQFFSGKKLFRHNTTLSTFGSSASDKRLIIPDSDPVFGIMNHGCEDIQEEGPHLPMPKKNAQVFRHNTDVLQYRRENATANDVKKPQATRRSVSRQGSRLAREFRQAVTPKEEDISIEEFIKEHKPTYDRKRLNTAISAANDDLKMHREQASTHVQTAVIDKALVKVQELNYVVLTGSTGVGKTYTAISVLDHMISNNPEMNPLMIRSANDFNTLVDVTENLVVVVDDLGGDITVDVADIVEWNRLSNKLKTYIKEKKLYLILTAHNGVMQKIKSDPTNLKGLICSEALINFDHPENALTDTDKTEMCMIYAKTKNIPIDKKSVTFLDSAGGILGFPLLCKLMTRNNFSKLFESPIETIENQVNLVSRDAKSHFIVILLIFLFGGHLPQGDLSVDQERCYDEVLSFVKIRKNFNKIVDTAEGLVGTVVKYNKESRSFAFLHPGLLQVIMKWLWNNQRSVFIEFCPLKYFSSLKPESSSSLIEVVSNDTLCLDQSDFTGILNRFKHEFDTSTLDVMQQIAASTLWECSEFIQSAIRYLGLEFFFTPAPSNTSLFSYLSQLGKCVIIEKLVNHLESGNEQSILSADIQKIMAIVSRYCHYNVFKYLKEKTDNISEDVILAAAEGGDIEIMKLIATKTDKLIVETREKLSTIHVACLNGHKKLVKYLYKHGIQSLLLRDLKGQSILHHAVIGGNIGILKFLLSDTETFDSDLLTRTKTGTTLLHTACEHGWLNIVKFLYKRYPSMVLSIDQHGLIPADYAAIYGHVDCLEYLMREANDKSDVTCGNYRKGKFSDGRTKLHLACLTGKLGMVKYLCKTFPNMVTSENNAFLLPVHEAVFGENLDTIEYFITHIHGPLVVTSDGRTLLHIAAFEGKLEVVKHLCLNYRVMLEMRDVDGNTAEHDAAASGSVDILKYLVQQGMDPKSRNYDGCSLLHDAAYFGRIDMVKYLCETYPDMVDVCSNTGYSVAHAAALGDSVDVLKFLMSSMGERDFVSQDNSTLLHEAAYSGQLKMVQFLCSAYPDMINRRTKSSFTPCHYAVQEGHEEVATFLLGEICDEKILTNDGESLLHIAAYNGQLGMVKYLNTEFPDLIGVVDTSGATVLHAAARGGHVETMMYLLNFDIDPFALSENGSNILHLAAYDGRLEMVKYLCFRFPEMISNTDNTGHSTGHYAAGSGNVEVFKYLLSRGIDPLALTQNGSSCLLKAVYTGKIGMVEYLVKSFPELLKIADQYECTAAHYSACEGHVEVLKYLLSQGVSPLALTVDGHTVLHIAAFHGRLEVVAFLCKEYPKLIPLEDRAGQTVWTFAECGGHQNILGYLRNLKGKKRRSQKGTSDNTGDSQAWWLAVWNGVQNVVCCCRNK